MTWRESNTILRFKLHPSEAPMSDPDKGYGIRSMPTTMAPDESGNYNRPMNRGTTIRPMNRGTTITRCVHRMDWGSA